jgi:hypothetical protein
MVFVPQSVVAGPRTAAGPSIPYPPYRSRPGAPPHQQQQQQQQLSQQQQQQMMSKMGGQGNGQHPQSLQQQQQQQSMLQFQQQQQLQASGGSGSPNMGFTGHQQSRPNTNRPGQQQQIQLTDPPTQPLVTPTPELRQQIQKDAQTAAAIVALQNAQVAVKNQQQLNIQNHLKQQQVNYVYLYVVE